MFIPRFSILMWTIFWPIGFTFISSSNPIDTIQRFAQYSLLVAFCHVLFSGKFAIRRYPLALGIYLIVSVVFSLFYETNTLAALLHWFNYGLVTYLCFCYFSRFDAKKVLTFVFVSILLTFILTLIGEQITPSGRVYTDLARLSMSWANPISLGDLSILGIFSILALNIMYFSKNQISITARTLPLLAQLKPLITYSGHALICLSLVITILTRSFGPLTFLISVSISWAFLSGKKRLALFILVTTIGGWVAYQTGFLDSSIDDYLFRINVQKSQETRVNSYEMVWDLLGDNYMWGTGWTNDVAALATEKYNFRSESGWAMMLLEVGVARLVIFSFFPIIILYRFLRVYKDSDELHKILAALCVGSLVMNITEAVYSSLSSLFVFVFLIFWAQIDVYSKRSLSERRKTC